MLSFVSNLVKEWWNRVGEAPPATRNLDVCSISVFRKRGDQEEYLGNFAPELYVLGSASRGTLECQMLEKEWFSQKKDLSPNRLSQEYRHALAMDKPELYKKLYRKDGSRKTPFELALIPGRTTLAVTEAMQAEYRFRRDKQLPLPPMITKFRVVPDYLDNLPYVKNETRELPQWAIKLLDFADYLMAWPNYKTGISFDDVPEGELFLKSPVGQGLKLNINNPSSKATTFEKMVHYISQWAALFGTIGTAVSVGCVEWALGINTPWLLLGVVGATYLANKCGKDFGLFDIAEEINRARLLFTKDLALGKFSPSRALETSIYVAAAGFATYFATLGAWTGALALPWGSLASTVSPAILSVMKMGTAGFFATTAALAGVAGTYATRFFWRWSPFDNRIDFNTPKMQQMKIGAPAIDPAWQKAKAHLEKFVAALPPRARDAFEQEGRGWLINFGIDTIRDGRDLDPRNDFDRRPRRSLV